MAWQPFSKMTHIKTIRIVTVKRSIGNIIPTSLSCIVPIGLLKRRNWLKLLVFMPEVPLIWKDKGKSDHWGNHGWDTWTQTLCVTHIILTCGGGICKLLIGAWVAFSNVQPIEWWTYCPEPSEAPWFGCPTPPIKVWCSEPQCPLS